MPALLGVKSGVEGPYVPEPLTEIALDVNNSVPEQDVSLPEKTLKVIEPPAPLVAPDKVAESVTAVPTETAVAESVVEIDGAFFTVRISAEQSLVTALLLESPL